MRADEHFTRVWQVDRLTALNRDPYTLYVYWEVSDRRRQLISRHFSVAWEGFSFFLRLNDVTDLIFSGENAHASHFIAVTPAADGFYLRDLTPGRTYVVDFGLVLPTGHFFAILRGSPVATPPIAEQGTAERQTVRFMRLGQVLPAQGSEPETEGKTGSLSDVHPYEEEFDGYSAAERRWPDA